MFWLEFWGLGLHFLSQEVDVMEKKINELKDRIENLEKEIEQIKYMLEQPEPASHILKTTILEPDWVISC